MTGPRQSTRGLQRRSDFLVDLVVADLLGGPEGIQGRTLRLPTGQVATFARASAGAGVDSAGESYDAAPHRPAVSVTSGRAGIPIRPADAPRAVESLTIEHPGRIVAHSGYMRFVDRGAGGTASSRYLQWGNATVPRLIVSRATAGPAVNWEGGGGGQVNSTASVHQTSGQLVEFWWWLSATGTVRLSYRYDGGTLVELAESGTADAPPRTPAAPNISIGHISGGGVGGIEVQVARIHPDPEASVGLLQAGSGLLVPEDDVGALVVELLSRDPGLIAFEEVDGWLEATE